MSNKCCAASLLLAVAAAGCSLNDKEDLTNVAAKGRALTLDTEGVDRDLGNMPPARGWRGPKYVFYFIGDGMADVQIHATESYLAQLAADDSEPGSVKARKLAMSQFPVRGMSTTYAHNRMITGSAAAGTALACGKKTNIGVISMDPDATMPYKTLAEAAKERGQKVGIISSVSIDHATPAVFYSHQPSRSMYHEISMDLANSDFDYFGGGGFKRPQLHDADGNVIEDALAAAEANGYSIVRTREELESVPAGQKVIAYNHTLDRSKALYYELDRPADHISLAEFTRKGIELLDNRRGFFMMVEGGKIDWACHANDARAALDDVLAFDDAILEAVEFHKAHPRQTLIVVTGDHECGGMSIGFAGTAYESYYEVLKGQTMSYVEFDKLTRDYVDSHTGTADIDADMAAMIMDNFGLDFTGALSPETDDDLNDWEKSLLEDAFDRVMAGEPRPSYGDDPDSFLRYGPYTPLSVTLTHVLNRRAGIVFTSYYHSGVPVPVLALGRSSALFGGSYDNTDIAKRLAMAMRVGL
jgi:alkaline phosphatase